MSDNNILKRKTQPRTINIDGHTLTAGKPNVQKLKEIKKDLGLKSYQQVLTTLIKFYEVNK